MKRGLVAVLAASMVVGMLSIVTAHAAPKAEASVSRELACNVQAQAPSIVQGPKRLIGRATTSCTDSGSIDRIVVWTALQWFCCTETQIQTIALNKRRFNDSSGLALNTRAVQPCPPDTGFAYAFRTKVTVWVFDSYGDLLLRKVDFAPGGGLFRQRNCGDADGF